MQVCVVRWKWTTSESHVSELRATCRREQRFRNRRGAVRRKNIRAHTYLYIICTLIRPRRGSFCSSIFRRPFHYARTAFLDAADAQFSLQSRLFAQLRDSRVCIRGAGEIIVNQRCGQI